ncbi:AzlD domain-containing protein [Paenibacillus sp. MBLB4367]|uniref:AzlD domain-containing protein n=1 Tax=Paenibacillus sp. MBLB4367 TaxID=3384767 RepID=UPI003908292C
MEIRWSVFLIVIGASLVTLIPRVVPLMILSRFELPGWAMRWLNYVPISVMAALIGQELFLHDGKMPPLTDNAELIAALPAFFVAVRTRSILATVVVGVAALMVLRSFL